VPDFETFFRMATGKDPFPYQAALAEREVFPELVRVPTGAGKTAAAVLGWLYHRRFHPSSKVRKLTPRRLVYCLPMRVLVEQTLRSLQEWLRNVGLAPEIEVHQLMGGSVERDWVRFPERDAILVGTMDMLLSRALNRGFAESRFRWPIDFGLINNDTLWVLDEVQLMGNGLATSVQLDAFRRSLGTARPTASLWMSATLAPEWLATVDREVPPEVLELSEKDQVVEELRLRLRATKVLHRAERPTGANWTGSVVSAVEEEHVPGKLTLVVLNTVDRALELYRQLRRRAERRRGESPELLLLHSRFRPPDRREKVEALRSDVPEPGRIVVSTQVVEAGVDISAVTLFTEAAPWGSVVQRLGRCNRFGKVERAKVFWLDLSEREALPYEPNDLARAREILTELEGAEVGPAAIESFGVGGAPVPTHVLRRRDLIELFDTEPDLSGNDIDVSRFIRDDADVDTHVFWREWDGGPPPADLPRSLQEELCPVPAGRVRSFLADHVGWVWDHLERRWRRAGLEDARPGQVVLFHAADGGYSPETGWDPGVTRVGALQSPEPPQESMLDEPPFEADGAPIPLREHVADTVSEVNELLAPIEPDLARGCIEALKVAARWHDLGKAHWVFQDAILRGFPEGERAERARTLWAKSPGRGASYSRKHFRHELAGALALLQAPPAAIGLEGKERDLAAYLVASHHGKVRLAIRSLPGETQPEEPDRRFARGVWDDDPFGPVDLDGASIPEMRLDLAVMEIGLTPDGAPSWLERTLALRDELGPFRLAFLEALLRMADWRGSEAEEGSRA